MKRKSAAKAAAPLHPIPKDSWIEVIDGENEFDRNFRAGVLRAAGEAGFVRVRLVPEGQLHEDWKDPDFRAGPPAVIGALWDRALLRELRRAGVPCVLTGVREGEGTTRAENRAVCSTDNRAVGRMAAEYLLGPGRFRSFAFAPAGFEEWGAQAWWIRRRAEAFAATLAAAGKTPAPPLPIPSLVRGAGRIARDAFREWAEPIPKPLAIFAANDLFARQIAVLCDLAHVRVPDEIAILGVDNDATLCETAATPLSSIALETGRLGREAFSLAVRMLRGERLSGIVSLCPPSHVAERRSTSAAPLEDAFVARAVDWISAHAEVPMEVPDVVAACGTSRRFLERRMRTLTGRTILETIHEKRLGAVVRRLRDTDEPAGLVSDKLGFSSPAALSALFHRRFGRSMRDFRADLRRLPLEDLV